MSSHQRNSAGEKSLCTLSTAEADAISALKAAVRSMPPGLILQVDQADGVMNFWRRVAPGQAVGVGAALRCKRVLGEL